MAGVVKNMMVRVGADISGLIGEFKKSGKATESFAKQASNALRQATLSEANLKKAMAQGGKNSYIVNLTDQIRELEQEQKALKAAGFGWGYEGFEGNEILLESLKNELNDYVKSVREAGKETDKTGTEIKKLGSASQQSSTGIQNAKKQMSSMKSHTKSAHVGVEGLLRSIRRLGVVSLGLRFVRSVFGELGSIVRQYVSENSALQAQVNTLKASMGQALAPAINVVTNAFSRLMPYIIGVSNAIGSLVSSLFGSGWANLTSDANAATKAIGGAGGAAAALNRQLHGFDEITKVNEKNGGGGGGLSSAAESIGGIVPEGLNTFINKIKESIEKGDWEGIGKTVAELLNGGMQKLSSADTSLGSTIAQWINNSVLLAKGFIQNFDWSELGKLVTKNLYDVITGIDYAALSELTGTLTAHALLPGAGFIKVINEGQSTLKGSFEKYYQENSGDFKWVGGALVHWIWEGFREAIKSTNKKIKEDVINPFIEGFKKALNIGPPSKHPEILSIGKNIILGIFEGMSSIAKARVERIEANVVNPFIEGFKKAFNIGPPSKHPGILGIGKNIILGIFGGMLEIAKAPLNWIKTNVFNPIQQAMQNLFDGTSMADFKVGVKNDSSKWWSNVKTWWSQKVGEVKLFTTGVKNESASWWTNVQEWWRQSVGEVKSFSTGVVNDSETWWSNVKTWWDGKKGTLLMDAFVRDGASDWWENVKKWWNEKKGTLLMNAFVRDGSDDWWSNVKDWWSKAVGYGALSVGVTIKNEASKWWESVKTWWSSVATSLTVSLGFNSGVTSGSNQQINSNIRGGAAALSLGSNSLSSSIAGHVAAQMLSSGQTGDYNLTVNLVLDGKVITSTVVRNVNAQARATGHNPLSAWI